MGGVQVKDVANALDIHPFMLSLWRKAHIEGKIVADKQPSMADPRKQKNKIDRIIKLEKIKRWH